MMGEVIQAPMLAGGRIAGIIPQTIDDAWRVAQAMHKSGLAPQGMKSAEQLLVAIMHGLEVGLPPMQAIQRIAVINGRPTIWGEAVPALLWSRKFTIKEWHDEDTNTAFCTITRPEGGEPITRAFSEKDARDAGLWGKVGPWKQYPRRMLQMRARSWAARDGAADALAGLYLAEEAIDITPQDEPRKSSAAAKRDGTTEVFNEIRTKISEASDVPMLEQITDLYAEELGQMPRKWAQLIQDDYEVRLADLSTEAAQ